MKTVPVLFAARNSIYKSMPGVDVWDIDRDARNWPGGISVVAHPPCSRWCRLAALVEARWGYKRGDDGGLFAFALEQVRRFGGVLEHPAYSDAWLAFDLPPHQRIGWQKGICGGWSAHVEQGRYGHVAKKATWLYAYGVDEPPPLLWGADPGWSQSGAGVVVRQSYERSRSPSARSQGCGICYASGVRSSARRARAPVLASKR